MKPNSNTADNNGPRPPVDWRVAALAGIGGGIVATAVQLLLWWLFTDDLPEIFFRDARLTAAIVMGARVLPPPAEVSVAVMVAATLVHLALSAIYGLVLAVLIAPLDTRRALLLGAIFGLLLYVINLYGFVAMFPWFAVARDWITLVAHLAFGVSAAAAYRAGVPAA